MTPCRRRADDTAGAIASTFFGWRKSPRWNRCVGRGGRVRPDRSRRRHFGEFFSRPFAALPAVAGLGRLRRAQVDLVGVVEEGEELVVLALRQRVVLVVVALGAADRQAEPDRRRRVDAVDDRLDAELLLVDAALVVGQRVAVEAGGQLLREAGAGQQVAGQLLDGELVERQVAVEGADDPVAVAPGVRPRPCPSRSRRCRRSGPGRASAGPSARRSAATPAAGRPAARRRRARCRRRRRRPPRGVGGRPSRSRRQPADQRERSASGDGAIALRLQPGQDEAVDRVAGPGGVLDRGRCRLSERREGPVRRPRRPLGDPLPQPSICSADKGLFPGGMRCSVLAARRSIGSRRLPGCPCRSPGRIARRTSSRRRKLRPPCRLIPPWHGRQCFWRMGWMSRVKSSGLRARGVGGNGPGRFQCPSAENHHGQERPASEPPRLLGTACIGGPPQPVRGYGCETSYSRARITSAFFSRPNYDRGRLRGVGRRGDRT